MKNEQDTDKILAAARFLVQGGNPEPTNEFEFEFEYL